MSYSLYRCLGVALLIAIALWTANRLQRIQQEPPGQALIQQLAARFEPAVPDCSWGWHVRSPVTSPVGQDEARVERAYHSLKSLGIAAFPALVANSADPRYSFSATYAAVRNHSVGDACWMIIDEQLNWYGHGYKSRAGTDGKSHRKPHYLWEVRTGPGLPTWWATRQNRSLRDLQLEALRWTIAQEQAIGFANDHDRAQILGPLEKRLAELEAEQS